MVRETRLLLVCIIAACSQPTPDGPAAAPDADGAFASEAGSTARIVPAAVVTSSFDAEVAPIVDAGAGAFELAAAPTPVFRIVAYGDSRSHPDRHRRVADAIEARAPSLVLFTGDAEVSYSPAALGGWLSMLQQRPALAALLETNRLLFARGNHDDGIEEDARWPMLSRQPPGSTREPRYAFLEQGVFFVSLGCSVACAPVDDAGVAFLRAALSTPEARDATWRVVFAHGPVYDSGLHHPMAGNGALEAVLDEHHVDLHVAGHEHLYERSHQLLGGQVVNRGDELQAGAGTVYVVSGGGGAPFYDAGAPQPTSHAIRTHTNHFCEIDATPTALRFAARDTNGAAFDAFTIRR